MATAIEKIDEEIMFGKDGRTSYLFHCYDLCKKMEKCLNELLDIANMSSQAALP